MAFGGYPVCMFWEAFWIRYTGVEDEKRAVGEYAPDVRDGHETSVDVGRLANLRPAAFGLWSILWRQNTGSRSWELRFKDRMFRDIVWLWMG